MHATTATLILSLCACLVASVVCDAAMSAAACAKTVTHTPFVTNGLDSDRSATSLQTWTASRTLAVSGSLPSQRAGSVGAAACRSSNIESQATAEPVPRGISYMIVVDRWRANMGLTALRYNATLEANAMDTVASSNGKMVHKLNPGTFGQVLAPGSMEDFEHVFVGGWLCEIPRLPGLQGVCEAQSGGWAYKGQTGHAKILVSGKYSSIGCALYAGIWCCDLA